MHLIVPGCLNAQLQLKPTAYTCLEQVPSFLARTQGVWYLLQPVAGAGMVHVWTQSVEVAEVKHVLEACAARRAAAGSVSASNILCSSNWWFVQQLTASGNVIECLMLLVRYTTALRQLHVQQYGAAVLCSSAV